ncbi:MAG: ABC transporter substrate-binding protein [Alphaproteobacteria bacterium]|jgi:branched-chain amino acid transport system substrate-binding protein|nr:ABC transporter substrate-binding protein [Alphaproteobacteria bacterium]
MALAVVAVIALTTAPSAPAVGQEQFVPLLVYRTGAYAPNGIPLAEGQRDYFAMLNARDGGIGGVELVVEACDTAYNNDKGVECYERLKDRGPTGAAAFSPFSTGISYALIERATADEIPLFTMGYGRTDAADGTVFPYVFTMPATYWSQATSIVRYIEAREGDLAGKDIALVHHDSAYGKEPIATLEVLAAEMGFELHLFPVAHPGLEQKATWLDVGRRLRPDWVLMWGWGVMNSTAIKEAAAVGYPMARFIGNHWSGAEVDVRPAGDAAVGYLAANFHAPGRFDVHAEILTHLYDRGRGAGDRERVGEVLYNRGVVNAAITAEAIRVAQGIHGARPLTGAEVRDGFENLELTSERLAELGLDGFMNPLEVSCADHEGGGSIFIQRWDGESWQRVSDWIPPMTDVVRPLIERSAAAYAAETGITPRDCGEG